MAKAGDIWLTKSSTSARSATKSLKAITTTAKKIISSVKRKASGLISPSRKCSRKKTTSNGDNDATDGHGNDDVVQDDTEGAAEDSEAELRQCFIIYNTRWLKTHN